MPNPIKAARFVHVVLIICMGVTLSCQPKVQINLPNDRWEHSLFKGINRITAVADIDELRKLHVNKDDIQVRIWRDSPSEGVVITRTSGRWSAQHIKITRYAEGGEAEEADVIKLEPPKSGWNPFWQSVVDKGLLTLPDASEIDCLNREVVDGTVYVVEINQDNSYRTYAYGPGNCPELQQMREIAEIIALEFNSGEEECKRYEWFPCMTFNKSRGIPNY